MKKQLFIVFLSLFLTSLLQARAENVSNSSLTYKILIIHSYTEQLAAYSEFGSLVEERLKEQNINITTQTFYLDSEKYNAHDEEERMYKFLDSIQSWKPDLILVNDDQATYSLMACNHPLIKNSPVIFSAVNFPNWEMLKKYPNVRGFWDKPDYLTNIRLIEKLYGSSSRILLFRTPVFLGKQAFASMQDQLKNSRVSIRDGLYKTKDTLLSVSGHSQLFTAVTTDLSARQLLGVFDNKFYTACLQIVLDFNVLTIGRLANAPNFTVVNTGFNDNRGVTGGYFTTLEKQVEEVADAAAKVLIIKDISVIPPIRESKKAYAFDWNELERFHINRDLLPTESTIYNMPFTEHYRIPFLITSATLLLLMIYVIIHLFFMYRREAKRKKLAQENLLKEKNFLRLALEGGNTYAWRLESDIFMFEKEFFTVNHITSPNIPFEKMVEVIHPDDRENFCFHIKEVFSGISYKATSQCRFNFDGEGYIWWEFRYNHEINQEDTETLFGVCLNIQSFKDKEKKLIVLQEKAEEANKMKTAFLANMSHEIRTPLNAIVGFTNLLQEEEELTEEEKSLFKDTINKNSNLLLQLINDILELSRIESNRMSFSFEKFKAKDLLNDIYQTHSVLMPEQLKFLKNIPDLPVEIEVDKHRFIQVITNFINNAVKFTSEGYILLGYEYNEEVKEISIYVEDTGIGMSYEAQQKVFDRFYKQDEFAQGTGLGLAICKTIIERLHGEIILTSKQGKGSRFTIKLPYI